MERMELPSRARRSMLSDHHRQPAMHAKPMRAAITEMLQMDVSTNNTTYGNATATLRHHLSPAFARPVRRSAFAGDCRRQPAPRGHDDIRNRRWIYPVAVLGDCVFDPGATAELVHVVWSACAVTGRGNCDRMAREFSGGFGAVCDQLRGAATSPDPCRILRVASDSGRRVGPT